MQRGELTPKQAEFCRQYMLDFNGTQAAIRAGYSEATSNEQAARLLANVSIRAYLADLAPSLTPEMIASEWERIATYDPSRVYTVDEHGIPRIDFTNATPEDLSLIAEVSNEIQLDSEDKRIQKARVKLHSRTEALDNLGKIKGMYRQQITVTTLDGEALVTQVMAALAEYHKDDPAEFARVAAFIKERMP